MTDSPAASRAAQPGDRLIRRIIRIELVTLAVTFFVFASLHLGVHPLAIQEPLILPAAVVETVCGLCFAVAAGAAFTGATWAWPAAVWAHAISVSGVLLGILAQARSAGSTELNFVYHRVVLVVLLASLILLLIRRGRIRLAMGAGR